MHLKDPVDFMVACGNPADGFTYFGPISRAEDANVWAEHTLKNEEWWVIPLHPTYKKGASTCPAPSPEPRKSSAPSTPAPAPPAADTAW